MRLFVLLLLAGLAAGCATFDDLYREVERYPDDVYRDSRYPDPNHNEVRRDVQRYVRDVDRAVRLDSRQERRLEDLLEDRTYRTLERDRYDRRSAYPFPRSRRPSREVERWWRDTDRAIERTLSRRQRDEYRRFVRRFDDRDRRYDDDWDDDDWDDEDDDG